jgi:hypothetical protein
MCGYEFSQSLIIASLNPIRAGLATTQSVAANQGTQIERPQPKMEAHAVD